MQSEHAETATVVTANSTPALGARAAVWGYLLTSLSLIGVLGLIGASLRAG